MPTAPTPRPRPSDADALPHRVRQRLIEHQLWHRECLVVVAVSGGPDSLGLLHALWRLRTEDDHGPALHVAHLDHRFRGSQSEEEARFVAHIAHEWNIPATVEPYDVPALAQATNQNRQAAARAVRYAFLARVALAVGADAVAVAHQADDQAETVLLHLLRGAGPAGLRGMRVAVAWEEWRGEVPGFEGAAAVSGNRPLLIRPLIDCTRAEIVQYCDEHRLAPRHDPSNESRSYTRNRIRADLLPHLAEYNRQIVAALGRTAQVCADDYAGIQAQLDAVWTADLVRPHEASLRFCKARWAQLLPALQRYVLRRAARLLTGTDELDYTHVEAGRMAVNRATGFQQPLGLGLVLRVEYETFLVGRETPAATGGDENDWSPPQMGAEAVPLVVPGITPISPSWAIESRWVAPAPGALATDGRWRWWAVLDADAFIPDVLVSGPGPDHRQDQGQDLEGPVVRRRRVGDRFRPAGGAGSRLLTKFFGDQKVPQAWRAAWPVLATSSCVVWVVGLRVDQRFQATGATRRPLWLLLRRGAEDGGDGSPGWQAGDPTS
ncbi:MAG: tRNA lysidine(34) synthetase TilS [Chloroflexaceae bacterium]|nr:tRNA lysidine(34) synthetase TilS [Chloroflexaceae bacterium]